MSRKIFVNLPVQNLDASIKFFTGLGFKFNPQFTDDTATCMIISNEAYVMLLTHAKFQSFAPNPVADAADRTEVLVALSCDSREEVDAMVRDAVAAGGRVHNKPQDHGFMYQHGFQDPDGHVWELVYMDPEAIPAE